MRLIQGFIHRGGGSRRFIYGPEKLNPEAHTWMANKFQSAILGALLGTNHLRLTDVNGRSFSLKLAGAGKNS